MKKIDWIIIVFIVLASLFTLKDFTKPFFYTSHDGIHQVIRLYHFDQALRDGQIPVRWAGGLLNGFGYPIFVFSYHLPWLIAEPFYYSGFSIFESIKITFLIGYLISGITMYWYLRKVFGRFPAFFGVLLYLYAPYRFSNIFVRAAIGDATSFIFLPLPFLALYASWEYRRISWKWIVVGAIGCAGLLLSHAMVFLLAFAGFTLYALYHFLLGPNRKSSLLNWLLISALGLGLGSYYFIPSLIEKNWTRFSDVMNNVFTGGTFVSLSKLIYSPWDYGLMGAQQGEMSYQIGIVQWIVVGLVIAFLIFQVLKKRTFRNIFKHSDLIFFISLFIICIVLMLPISLPIWKLLASVMVIDFTWRILPVTVLSVSWLGAYLVRNRNTKSIILTIFLMVILFYVNRNYLRINKIQDWDVPFYLKLEQTTNMYDEYMPKWVRSELTKKIKPKIEMENTNQAFQLIEDKTNRVEFEADIAKTTKVTINSIYYPGWELWIDGNISPFQYRESGGLVQFSLEPGKHRVEYRFSETPLRKFGDSVTILSFMILLWGCFHFYPFGKIHYDKKYRS